MNAVTSSILNRARLLTHVAFADRLTRGMAFVRAIGPYAAVEIILPGGTLLALIFWLYRRYQRGEPLPPVITRIFKIGFGGRRLVEAARAERRLGHRDVPASVCTACV
jgi:hypothetical protein